MTHGSLFSGIGGFDLAARWAGFDNKFWCEFDPFCRRVLRHHFPESAGYEDIKTVDFTPWRGRIDLLTGGFPCQPMSIAGKRQGQNDERYLWPEMLRAIREIRPTWVIGENVGGLLSMVESVCEDGVDEEAAKKDPSVQSYSKRYLLDRIAEDLENEGYRVQPVVIPACAVGAPHRRDRVWIIAHTADARAQGVQGRLIATGEPCALADAESVRRRSGRRENLSAKQGRELERAPGEERSEVWGKSVGSVRTQPASDTEGERAGELRDKGKAEGSREGDELSAGECAIPNWDKFPTLSPVCGGDDGLPDQLDGITLSRWRSASIKAYGNAIVPQVACEIMRIIKQIEIIDNK